ncbi:MAG: hypothetical protein RLY20_1716 [Verrucomicrobiota bacterium]|jgi:DNA-binding beta-propeller fold protein YncE
MIQSVRQSTVRFAALVTLGLLASCASRPAPTTANANPIVWPAPPNPARFAFERSISGPSDLGVKRSTMGRFADWLTGETRGNGAFARPFGLALDEDGNLCVTDTAAKSVGCFDAKTTRWHRWTAVGKREFESPVSVAKAKDVLYVADSGRGEVIAFDVAGHLKFVCREHLSRPVAVLLTGERLLVADSERHAIVVFNLRGEYESEFGKRGTAPGEFNFPTHLATDAAGKIYVTDSMNCRVQIFDAKGEFCSQIGRMGDSPGCFSRPKGVAVSPQGHIYVADALFDNVQVFNAEGRLLLPVGEAGNGPGEFGLPAGIAIARDNRIYIADCYNSRVQVLRYLGDE